MNTISNSSWARLAGLAMTPILLVLNVPAPAQTSNILTVTPPPGKTAIRRGQPVTVTVRAQLAEGYHANSNTPSDDYLIPMKLTWESNLLGPATVRYPKPVMEKYEFTDKPISVFTGGFDIQTTFKAPPTAPAGTNIVLGKLRYQACTRKLCLPPKTVEVRLPVEVR